MDKMLKVKDIQDNLGMSQAQVYKLIKSKGFPKITIGHRYYIPETQYDKWVEQNLKQTIFL